MTLTTADIKQLAQSYLQWRKEIIKGAGLFEISGNDIDFHAYMVAMAEVQP